MCKMCCLTLTVEEEVFVVEMLIDKLVKWWLVFPAFQQ